MWKKSPLAKSIGIALLCVAVVSCDADVRPLEEQIEAASLNLGSLFIVPPPNALDPLIIASDQQLQLSLSGTTVDGTGVAVSGNNRRWSSNDTSVLTIDEDGVVLGQGPGIAIVSVLVGESVALNPMSITVSNAPLLGIASISSGADVDGAPIQAIDPCVPVRFSAVGDFGNGDERALSNVVWSVDGLSSSVGAQVFTNSGSLAGTTLLVGRTPSDGGATVGPISLTATTVVDDDSQTSTFSSSRDLTVADSLTSLSVIPVEASVFAGTTKQFTAPATYSTNTNQSATNGVDWSITAGSLTASVEGLGDNPGFVTGLVAGTATLTASCGPFSESVLITVTGNEGDLSFNRSGDLVLDLEDATFDDLEISLGDEFDPALEVTDEAEWESSDTEILTVDNEGGERGDLTLLSVGTVQVSATFDTTRISLTVEVQ